MNRSALQTVELLRETALAVSERKLLKKSEVLFTFPSFISLMRKARSADCRDEGQSIAGFVRHSTHKMTDNSQLVSKCLCEAVIILPLSRYLMDCCSSFHLRYPQPSGSRLNCILIPHPSECGMCGSRDKRLFCADSNRRLNRSCHNIVYSTTELPFTREGFEPSHSQVILNSMLSLVKYL